MSGLWLIVILLFVFSFIGAPGIGYWHHGYGYWPSGLGGLIVLVLVILLLTGRL